jgi:hypothetical protein
MNFLAKILLLVCVLSFLARPTAAQEPQVGSGLLCNTAAQAQKVATDGPTAVQQVNAEAGDNACAYAQVLYVRGETVARISSRYGSFEVVAVMVVGGVTPNGFVHIKPTPQFTLFATRDKEA